MPDYDGPAEIWNGDVKVADVHLHVVEGRAARKKMVDGRVVSVASTRIWQTYLDPIAARALGEALDEPDLHVVVGGRRHRAFHQFITQQAADVMEHHGFGPWPAGHKFWGPGLGPTSS